MISAQLLLPTKALYFSPDWDQFNSIKEAFLQKNMAYLPSMSIEYKWKTLITKFADAVPYLDRSHFYNFRDSRGRESVANPHVLDLSKVLDYFENFYFLYCNNHPNYQLSKEAKDSLLRNIIAGMVPGACEPGRVTQFENGLQKSRKDTDWILCELICHRDNIIHEIADEYNVKHCISQGYSIHTKMHMSMLARQFNLGVTPLQEVDDCYLRYTAKKQMASYFEQVFRIKFDEYEANAITNLSQHVMLELTDWLQHHQVNLAKWDKETITLTEGQLVSFHQFIPTFFEDKNAYNFGELAEDGVSYVLKNKHELYTEIQHCVKERLLQKGCFLNVSITDNLLENALVLEDVLWAQGVTKEDFKLYIQALRTFSLKADHSTTFFQTHPHVVAAYPSLIIPALTEHSELWASLPKLLRYNLQFIEALVKAIGQQLLVVKLDDEAILVELLLKITRANPEILSQLPAKVLDTKSIALKLVSRNGLLLRWLSTNLKADPQVMAVSCKQNQQAEIYTVSHEVLRAKTSECLKRISVRLSSHIMDCLRSSEDVYVLFEKAQHTEILLETKVISTGKLARLAQVLTPKELDAINQSRIKRSLTSLPHCQNNALRSFMAHVDNDLWSSSGYLAVKSKSLLSSLKNPPRWGLYLVDDYGYKLAHRSIEKSNQWILALISYQQNMPMFHVAFNTLADLVAQLKSSARALWAIAVSIFNWQIIISVNFLLYCFRVFVSAVLLLFVDLFVIVSKNIGLLAFNFNFCLSLSLFLLPLMLLLINLGVEYYLNGQISLWPAVVSFCLGVFFALNNCAEKVIFSLILPALMTAAFVGVIVIMIGIIIKIGSMITNTPLTFAEIKSQAVFAFIYCSSFSGDYFQVSSIEKLTAKTAPLSRWPQLLAVAIVPWFTRTWATIMASKTELTKGDSITLEVEENIFNLLNSDDPAAIRKGELLQEIWEQVQLDVAAEKINWNEVLDKQYAVDVAGKRSKISLNEVASAARVDDIKFSSSSSADRYAFFGGATTLQNVNPDAVTVLQTSAAFS